MKGCRISIDCTVHRALVTAAYLQAFSAQRFSVGAALAYLTVLAILVLAMIYLRLLRQNEMRAV